MVFQDVDPETASSPPPDTTTTPIPPTTPTTPTTATAATILSTTTDQPNDTTTPSASSNQTSSWGQSQSLMTIGLSLFLILGTLFWVWIWCRRKKAKETKSPTKRKSPKDRLPKSKSLFRSYRDEALPGSAKTPSLASIQSTGSNYYDQLMGSGNIPKVKSISQYGALLAQQEPPPP